MEDVRKMGEHNEMLRKEIGWDDVDWIHLAKDR
jgi:hypothetical protein